MLLQKSTRLSSISTSSAARVPKISRASTVRVNATLPNVEEARQWIANFKARQAGSSGSAPAAASPSSSNGAGGGALPNVVEARQWIANFKARQAGGSGSAPAAASPSSNGTGGGAPSSNGRPVATESGPVISYTAEQLQDASATEAAMAKVMAK